MSESDGPELLTRPHRQPLKAQPHAKLRGAWLAISAAQRCEDEEIRQPLIGAEGSRTRVVEVGDVEDVEQLEVQLHRVLLPRTEPVAEPHIGLLVGRSNAAIAPAVKVRTESVRARAAVVASRQKI